MALVNFYTNITSNTEIQTVSLSSLKFGETEILNQPVQMQKYANTYYCQTNIPDIYTNKNLTYTVEIVDLAPETVEPWMPESLRIQNTYKILGTIFVYQQARLDYKYCKRMFITLTGRYDLVANPLEDDYTDIHGILGFIFNNAQIWLDQQVDIHKFCGLIYKELPANQEWIDFKNVRYVKNVYEIKDEGLIPIRFTTIVTAVHPDQLENTLSPEQKESLGIPDILFTKDNYPVRIIYINPQPVDRKILIECFYYSPRLERDSDVSFWTMQAPEILVKTAYMKLQEINNNLEHASFLRQDILSQLIEMRRDFAEEKWGSIPSNEMKMEGLLMWQR